MVRLVLFDIDGTLIRTGGAGMEAFARTAHEVFERPEGTAGMNFHGRTDTALVREFFVRNGIEWSMENQARFFEAYLERLERRMSTDRGMSLPGVRELMGQMEALAERPALALLTGNIRRGAELKLRPHGLWDCFEFGAFGDQHEDRNELAVIARDVGSKRLERRLSGDEILVIGDTTLDVACARAIGARCLAVATGQVSRDELRAASPTWVCGSLGEIRAEEICG